MKLRREYAVVIRGVAEPQQSAMLVTCPRCGAGPNRSCLRTVGGRVQGKDTGGGYTVRLKNPHTERKDAAMYGEPTAEPDATST